MVLRSLALAAGALALLGASVEDGRASQLLDRNARDVTLRVSPNGAALITYRARGSVRRLLAWGGLNAVAPTAGRKQVAFRLDYSGGFARRARRVAARFGGHCLPYDGPPLAWLVTACKASDGSYWALQSWQRGLPNYGLPPVGASAAWELRLSHWQGDLPALTVSPVPLALGSDITWSPGLSLTNNTTSSPDRDSLFQVLPGGAIDTIVADAGTRVTALNFDTPVRLGSFNWQNSIQATDEISDGRDSVSFLVDDPSTPDPADSIVVRQVFPGDFRSTLDWDTGINLPILFRGSWKLQPSLGISNTTTGPFALRNRNTGGAWVQQGKRFRVGVSSAP